jgi:hypothetical protein
MYIHILAKINGFVRIKKCEIREQLYLPTRVGHTNGTVLNILWSQKGSIESVADCVAFKLVYKYFSED